MCRDRKRLLGDIDALYNNSQMWFRRATIMRAMLTNTMAEMKRIIKTDEKWEFALWWVIDTIETHTEREQQTEDFSI